MKLKQSVELINGLFFYGNMLKLFRVIFMSKTNCETCVNYYYDDELEEYCCDINLDEDEMVRFLTSSNYQCPYYRLYDEYGIVKKQN